MKRTVLQITQDVLSSLNSDNVNSISDTTESQQVANLIRQVYMNMIGRFDLPIHHQPINLTASGDVEKPTLMLRPSGVTTIEWIKYFDSNPADGSSSSDSSFSHDLNTDLSNVSNGWTTTSTTSITIGIGTAVFTVASSTLSINTGDTVTAIVNSANFMSGTVTSYSGTTLTCNMTTIAGSGTYDLWTINQFNNVTPPPGYKEVCVLPFKDFIEYTGQFNPVDSNVSSYSLMLDENATGDNMNFEIYYMNDRQPRFCTTIANGNYVLFDSYDNTQDTTLQAHKSLAMAWVYPDFTLTDNFTPVLDDQQFPLLINEVKSLAYLELKNMPHPKAEKEVTRQTASLQKNKAIADKGTSWFNAIPNYGRRGPFYG